MEKNQILFNTATGEKITDPEKIKAALSKAERIHLYSFINLLNPRGGTMEKESLSHEIYSYLKTVIESWTDSKYSDSLDIETVLEFINKEAHKELKVAIDKLENQYLK